MLHWVAEGSHKVEVRLYDHLFKSENINDLGENWIQGIYLQHKEEGEAKKEGGEGGRRRGESKEGGRRRREQIFFCFFWFFCIFVFDM